MEPKGSTFADHSVPRMIIETFVKLLPNSGFGKGTPCLSRFSLQIWSELPKLVADPHLLVIDRLRRQILQDRDVRRLKDRVSLQYTKISVKDEELIAMTDRSFKLHSLRSLVKPLSRVPNLSQE